MCRFFQRLSEESDVEAIGAKAKIGMERLIGIDGEAGRDTSDSKINLDAKAWISYSGCEIRTAGADKGTTESLAEATCRDAIEMAKLVRTTKQPGSGEIAILVPYR
jgi:hypothetical protein